jgi:hypothetical protein
MADLFTLVPIPPPPQQTTHSTEAKFLDPDRGYKVENLPKCIYKNLRNFKQHTLGCMAVPSSSMAIVDFIPQSGTLNLATDSNVVFHYFCTFLVLLQILQKD